MKMITSYFTVIMLKIVFDILLPLMVLI